MLRGFPSLFASGLDFELTVRRLELYFSDKRNFLIVFRDKRQRQVFMSRLQSKNDPRDVISKSVIGNLVLDTVARAMDRSEQQLEAMTRRWQSREITNVCQFESEPWLNV